MAASLMKENPELETTNTSDAKQRSILVEWLNSIDPGLALPPQASDQVLRAALLDSNVLSLILKRLRPSAADAAGPVLLPQPQHVNKFLNTLEEMGISRFQLSDLEKGSMKPVIECLLTIRSKLLPSAIEERWKILSQSKLDRLLCSPIMSAPTAAPANQIGPKFNEAFQLRQGNYADHQNSTIAEMMKSKSLDNAPTRSLLSVVNGILDESIHKKNGEIPHRFACLLRKVVMEIECRMSTQTEHLRTQNNMFKAREEKYKSRIRVLEALADGVGQVSEVLPGQIQQMKNRIEENPEIHEAIMVKLEKEKDMRNQEIAALKQEMQEMRKTYELRCQQLEAEAKEAKVALEEIFRDLEHPSRADSMCSVAETALEERIKELEYRSKEIGHHQEESCSKVEIGLDEKIEETEDLLSSRLKLAEMEQKLADSYKARADLEERIKQFGYQQADSSSKEKRVLEERTQETEDLLSSKLKVAELEQKLADSYKARADLEERIKQIGCQQADSSSKEKRVLEERAQETEDLLNSKLKLAELEQKLADSYKARADLEERIKQIGCQQADSSSKEKRVLEERAQETEDLLNSKLKLAELEQKLADSYKARADLEERIKQIGRQQADSSSKEKRVLEERIKELEGQLVDSRESRNKIKLGLEDKIKNLERQLLDSRNQMKEQEQFLESKSRLWSKKENRYKNCLDNQFGTLKELRFSSDFIKQEVSKAKKIHTEEINQLGVRFRALANAAENYQTVLSENRRLFNEIQDLKGNIRVYCRIRPFLPGQAGKQTIVEFIGDDGELVVANPSKPGKESHRMFKFNKVFGPAASQVEVYSNIQPFVRSVVDGYNVCIFAYGQTGSGKTYTMTGPNDATEATLGVNYRALNDLFQISENRSSTITYEVMVQMIEIYNEQVRDLLSTDGTQKKLGIVAQGSGLTVPDACIHNVRKTSDVLDLMEVGFKNRSVSATAMNERSSRSHSVITIHVRGKELKTGTTLRGSLHLVDLAGSERVDRSEVAGDRLKEAQHINKSLSALGDVIFALSQKNAHVPYRNSKLTQLLQSSLGGQAKTLMFVQLNPDVSSYSESLSTLKFAERVSGIELGAAKSSREGKDGKDVRELMEQVSSLKDTINKREEEIEKLQLFKEVKNTNPGAGIERSGSGSSRYASPTPIPFAGDMSQSMLSLEEQDFEESDASEFLEAEIDNRSLSPPEGIQHLPNNLERSKSASKVVRPPLKSVHTTSMSRDSPRNSPNFRTPTSSLKSSSKRWN